MELGQIVYSIKGRDAGNYFLVVGIKDKYVYICNGKLRSVDNPKKKNICHVKVVNKISIQAQVKIYNNTLDNNYVKKVLEEYMNTKESISETKEV